MSSPRRIVGFAIVALALALALPAAAQAPGGQVKDRGFALEVHVGTSLVPIGNTASLNALDGGFFAGAKIGRLIIGGGIDYQRIASGGSVNGVDICSAPDNQCSSTRLLFVPGVRFSFLRSADERVDLYGQLDIGLGLLSPADETEKNFFLVRYQVGPGLRLWFHPQMAFGAVVGVRGDFASHDTGVNSSESTGFTSIFAQFNLMGVF
ncbi:MAG TPA: hypothetical protein VGQ83_04165 [Polyangia bacterium]|jgi:hypothetical protein